MSDGEPVAILGTGAVGVFLGAALARGGTTPLFLSRGGEAREVEWQLVDTRNESIERLRAPVEPAQTPHPELRHLVVCVRGDQVDAAVASAAELAPNAALGLAPPLGEQALARLRARHPVRVLYLLVPMFNAWSDGELRYRWLHPPLVKTLLSGEGDAQAEAAARDMTGRLVRGRMRARTIKSATAATATFFNAGLPLLVAWELSRWSRRVIDGSALRRTTARAMHEALALTPEARGAMARMLRLMPASLVSAALWMMRWLVNDHLLAMWQHHGPKIAQQTRGQLDEMLARAGGDPARAPSLHELRRRLDEG